MKTLELNPNDEPIMDMIRTACIDSKYPYICNYQYTVLVLAYSVSVTTDILRLFVPDTA